MYFNQFPKIVYQFSGDVNGVTVTDIIRRVKVRDNILTTAQLYDIYTVKDGETPHILAAKYYGDPNLHWVLMLTNTIIDPNFDWPMSVAVLNNYINNKYGASNRYLTHHYELYSPYPWRNGMVMPHDTSFSDFGADLYNASTESVVPITNEEYEESLNDERRQIKLFKPELIPQFLNEFTRLVAQ